MSALEPVFVHGWACGPEIWQPLQATLGWQAYHSLDLGYFTPSPTEKGLVAAEFLAHQNKQPKLFICHSLGCLWVLSHCVVPEGSRIVAINAFGRFAAAQDFTQGVPLRVLGRMQAGLARNAAQGVNAFRARCGVPDIGPESCNVPALQAGLALLAQGDVRANLPELVQQKALLVLAGSQDPIVPPAMTQAAFPADVACHWQAQAGHMLPLTHPEFCAEQIKTFLR